MSYALYEDRGSTGAWVEDGTGAVTTGPPVVPPVVGVTNPGAQAGQVGDAVSLQITARDFGGLTLTYAAAGLPAGLSIGPATGLITGTLTTAQARTVTVTASDPAGGQGQASFTWTVTTGQPPPPPSTVAMGTTLNLGAFPAGSTQTSAMKLWKTQTGTTMMSTKVYYNGQGGLGSSSFPTTLDDKLKACVALGMVPVIVFEPAPDGSSPLVASLEALHDAGLSTCPGVTIVLWQEPQAHGPKITAADFIKVHQAYYPRVKASGKVGAWQVVVDHAGSSGLSGWQSYTPVNAAGNPAYCDGYALDLYAVSWDPPGGGAQDPTKLEAMADAAGLSFGWFEMGLTASTGTRPTDTKIRAYFSGIQAQFANRVKAGKPCAPLMWWNGLGSTSQGINCLVPLSNNPANNFIAQPGGLWPVMYNAILAA